MLQIRVGVDKNTPFILSTAILRHIPGRDPSADAPALTLLCLEAARVPGQGLEHEAGKCKGVLSEV